MSRLNRRSTYGGADECREYDQPGLVWRHLLVTGHFIVNHIRMIKTLGASSMRDVRMSVAFGVSLIMVSDVLIETGRRDLSAVS